MKTILLLPNKCKIIGLILIVIGILIGVVFNEDLSEYLRLDIGILGKDIFSNTNKNGETNMTTTISLVLLIVGGMMTAFSREKIEDEFIAKLRLTSWIWAILINYTLLLIAILLAYGGRFLDVILYNMFTPLVIFILCFNLLLYKHSYKNKDEE